MTPLISLMQKYRNLDWQPQKQTAKAKIDSKGEIFIEAINLIWNLCEANATALKLVNDNGLISIIMKHVNIDVYGYRVGMISHKKSLITIFGHKYKIKNFIKKFDIFHKKISTAFDFGLYLE